MKLTRFMALMALPVALFNFTACDDDDDDKTTNEDTTEEVETEVTSLTLNKQNVEIAVGETVTLIAVAETDPEDADIEYTWTVGDESIVAVAEDGESAVIKGLKAGETSVKVSAGKKSKTCFVTITEKQETPETPETPDPVVSSYDYFVIMLDDDAYATLDNACDLRVNDNDSFLYIWENTYKSFATTGVNSKGNAAGWWAFEVTNVGWSGAGVSYQNKTTLAYLNQIQQDNGEGWYLHFAAKVNSDAAHLIGIGGETEYKFAINNDYIDNGQTFAPKATVTADSEWHEVEVSMSEAISAGLVFSDKPTKNPNLFFILSGGVAGTQIELDAIYIYKK